MENTVERCPEIQTVFQHRLGLRDHFRRRLEERDSRLPTDLFGLRRCLTEGRWYRHEYRLGRFYVIVPFDCGHLVLVVDRESPKVVLTTLFTVSQDWPSRFEGQRERTAKEVLEVGG